MYYVINYEKKTVNYVNRNMKLKDNNLVLKDKSTFNIENLDKVRKYIKELPTSFNKNEITKDIKKILSNKVITSDISVVKESIKELEKKENFLKQKINSQMKELRKFSDNICKLQKQKDVCILELYEDGIYVDGGVLKDNSLYTNITNCYGYPQVAYNSMLRYSPQNENINSYELELKALLDGLILAINLGVNKIFNDNIEVYKDVVSEKLSVNLKNEKVQNRLAIIETLFSSVVKYYKLFIGLGGTLNSISGSCNPADLGNHKKDINMVIIYNKDDEIVKIIDKETYLKQCYEI